MKINSKLLIAVFSLFFNCNTSYNSLDDNYYEKKIKVGTLENTLDIFYDATEKYSEYCSDNYLLLFDLISDTSCVVRFLSDKDSNLKYDSIRDKSSMYYPHDIIGFDYNYYYENEDGTLAFLSLNGFNNDDITNVFKLGNKIIDYYNPDPNIKINYKQMKYECGHIQHGFIKNNSFYMYVNKR